LNVDIKEISASGIELVEEIMEYDTAIIVDAIATSGKVGAVRKLTPEQMGETIHFTTPHHFNFASAYEFGKLFASENMPKNVIVYVIEIEPRTDFSEKITPNVAEAAELVSTEIIRNLTDAQVECPNT
jgi:hydrogenase maturation protease